MPQVNWSYTLRIKFRDSSHPNTITGVANTPAGVTAQQVFDSLLEDVRRQFPGRPFHALDFRATERR